MPTLSEEILSPAVLDQAVSQTFSLLVNCATLPTGTERSYGTEDLSLAVYCDQHQQSVVVVRCSRSLASVFAERMLEIPSDEVQENDRIDATGELVNVIAGTLRGLFPTIGTMSPPFQVPSGDLDHLELSERHYLVDAEILSLSVAFNY